MTRAIAAVLTMVLCVSTSIPAYYLGRGGTYWLFAVLWPGCFAIGIVSYMAVESVIGDDHRDRS